MNREDIVPYVYYKGEVLKRAGLEIIKKVALNIPLFKFFHDTLIAPFKGVDEKIKHENPYMEQIINNIERKKIERANSRFEKKFPQYASKVKPKIKKGEDRTLKEVVSDLVGILEK